MTKRDVAAALLCAVLWGLNFVVIDAGLRTFPPIIFVALRFLFTAVPAIFFVPRPAVGWRLVVVIGMLICVVQFGCLFVAMHMGMPAGLASIVMQSQAVFTVAFAAAALHEPPTRQQTAALLLAVAGLVIIAIARTASVPGAALLLCIVGGAAWGAGNVVTRQAQPSRPFSLLVYSAAVAPIPLTLISLVVEGWHADLTAMAGMTWAAALSLAYVVVGASLIGFGLWYQLLARYKSALVAPFTLLVPVVGLGAAWLFLSERPTLLETGGCLLVLAALTWLTVGTRRSALRPRRT